MKKGLKLLFSIVLSVMILLCNSTTVSAATLEDIFDAEYYADSYPDLKAAFGYDEGALYNHFLKYGLKENRNCSPILDVVKYRGTYADLEEAFGNDWDAYVNHYFEYGIEEDRESGGTFDPKAYVSAYGDIETAFGNDYEAIVNHYLTYGIKENRTAGNIVKGATDVRSVVTVPTQPTVTLSEPTVVPEETVTTIYLESYVAEDPFGEYPFNGGGNMAYGMTSAVGELTWEEIIAYLPSEIEGVDAYGIHYPMSITWEEYDIYNPNEVGTYAILGEVTSDDNLTGYIPNIIASVTLTSDETCFGGYYKVSNKDVTIFYSKVTEEDLILNVDTGGDLAATLDRFTSTIAAYDGVSDYYTDISSIEWDTEGVSTEEEGSFEVVGTVTGARTDIIYPDITVIVNVQ